MTFLFPKFGYYFHKDIYFLLLKRNKNYIKIRSTISIQSGELICNYEHLIITSIRISFKGFFSEMEKQNHSRRRHRLVSLDTSFSQIGRENFEHKLFILRTLHRDKSACSAKSNFIGTKD